MRYMGYDFKPPRRANLKQWRKVEIMLDKGYGFISCGCHPNKTQVKSLGDAKRLRVDRWGVMS